jgi:two-component system, chemotaxis family, CheB/CheR fusion protein
MAPELDSVPDTRLHTWRSGWTARPVVEAMESHTEDREAPASLQSVIDGLNANVVVLDRDGTIELVNTGWVRFAAENGDPGGGHTGPGTNYFDSCAIDEIVDGDFAVRALEGISRVLRREIPAFSLEYPCHSPQHERWFVMLVAPAGADGALVTHVDVSEAPRAVV